MNFTFPQSYYIGHDCPVPVDKHDCQNVYPTPLTPLVESKVQYLKLGNSWVNCQYFTEILYAGRGTIDMKHIRQVFSLKAWYSNP